MLDDLIKAAAARDLDAMALTLSATERAVLLAMTGGERVWAASYIAADAGVSDGFAKTAIRKFRRAGIARHGKLFDDDGHLCGSGTWLNDLGLRLQAHLG